MSVSCGKSLHNFTQGSITSGLLAFLMPFLVANILNNLYNAVDMMIIGKFSGSIGTVAVSLGGKMLNLLTTASAGIAGGGQIMIAQQSGAQRKNEIGPTIGNMIILMVACATALGILSIVFSESILKLMNTPEESFLQARQYLIITSLGLPLVFGFNAASAIMRGIGDSVRPLIFIAIAAAINLILDVVFIVNLDMGAMGTALATVIGQAAALSFAFVYIYRNRNKFGFSFNREAFKPDGRRIKAIVKIGLPLTVKGVMIHITQIFMLGYVNAFGIIQSAAYGIADKILTLCNIASISMSQAGSVVVAQNVGAGKYDRVKKTFYSGVTITLGFSIIMSFLSLNFPSAFFGLFSNDPDVLSWGGIYMRIAVSVFVLSALNSSLSMVTIGTGATRLAMLSGILDGIVFRVSLSFLFGLTIGMESAGFFLGNSLARLGPLIVEGSYFLSGKWKRPRISDK